MLGPASITTEMLFDQLSTWKHPRSRKCSEESAVPAVSIKMRIGSANFEREENRSAATRTGPHNLRHLPLLRRADEAPEYTAVNSPWL